MRESGVAELDGHREGIVAGRAPMVVMDGLWERGGCVLVPLRAFLLAG